MATAIVTVSNFSWEKFLNIEILLWSIRAGISLNVWECWNECVLSTEREGGGDRGSRQHRNWATTFIDVILECVSCTAPLARLGIITLLPYMISPFSTTDNSFLWDQNSFKHGLWSSFDQPWRIFFRTCLSALSHDVKPASCFGDNGLVDTVYSIEIELLCLYLHCCNYVSLLLPSRGVPSFHTCSSQPHETDMSFDALRYYNECTCFSGAFVVLACLPSAVPFSSHIPAHGAWVSLCSPGFLGPWIALWGLRHPL